jgi:type I restriction enzyme S subunit
MQTDHASAATQASWLYHPEFPDTWRRYKLHDLASWINGMAFREFHFTVTGRPVIKIAEIKGGISWQTKFTSREYDPDYLVSPGDLLFSWSGQPESSIDAFWWWGPEGWLNQHIFKVLPTADLLATDFLFYILRYLKPNFIGIAKNKQTTGLGHVTKADLRRIEVGVPPEEVQSGIVKLLKPIDDKIRLNAQINRTLEQLTQTVFRHWFVDFLPVRAKAAARAEGRDPLRATMCALSGKDEASLDAMPLEQYEQLAAIATLFPDELVDSELGEAPRGWQVRPLPEMLEINPPRPLRKGSAAPYLDMASVPTNSARVAHVGVRAFGSGSKFRNGDTLLARITPCLENGKTAFVDFLEPGEVGWGSTEFIVLRPKPPLPEAFAYFLCRDPGFRSFAIANMAGTTGRQRVPNDCFANYHIAVPDGDTAQAFGRFATGCLDLMRARDAESRTLAELRDTLLPKLLSGEIRVGEAEELMEAAA